MSAILVAVLPGQVVAQAVRVGGTTNLQFVTLRSLVTDSVPVGSTSGTGLLRHSADGTIVRCVTGETVCRYTRSGDVLSTIPLIQDITLSAWGFGRGLSIHAQLRTRQGFGVDEDVWPRASDAFDALVAYFEMDRVKYRLRAGRQWKVSGLGYYSYDGASIVVRPLREVAVEAFGGWSLVRGLNEPHTSESLDAIEPLAPDRRALLLGLGAAYHSPLLSMSGLYQREIRDDRLGLYAERVALDGSWRRAQLALTGSFEADVATRTVNEARLDARYRPRPELSLDAFARRYRPYFELWTIWGAFAPVGFTEYGLAATLQLQTRPLSLRVDGSRRNYPETGASSVFGSYRGTGWRAGATVTFVPDTMWLWQAVSHTEMGFGAARNELGLHVRRALADGAWIGARAIAFQRAFEIRVSDGTVAGLAVEGAAGLTDRVRLYGTLAAYRHLAGRASPEIDWSQLRGLLRFDWTIGTEPDIAPRAGANR